MKIWILDDIAYVSLAFMDDGQDVTNVYYVLLSGRFLSSTVCNLNDVLSVHDIHVMGGGTRVELLYDQVYNAAILYNHGWYPGSPGYGRPFQCYSCHCYKYTYHYRDVALTWDGR